MLSQPLIVVIIVIFLQVMWVEEGDGERFRVGEILSLLMGKLKKGEKGKLIGKREKKNGKREKMEKVKTEKEKRKKHRIWWY